MVSKSYKASAPATVMLFGEHAVLNGSMAIACALDKYITITLVPRTDNKIIINSKLLGTYKTTITNLKIIHPFKFVLSSVLLFIKKIKVGFDLEIKADFSDKEGLGSSAAVTVATISVLEKYLNKKIKLRKLFKLAKKVILEVQGIGSGADIAACVYNGVVAYKMKPLYIKKLTDTLPLTIVYSGSKKPTIEVIKIVKDLQQKHPKVFKTIYAAMDQCSKQAIKVIKIKDRQKLGELMNIHHGLQEAIGTSNEILSKLVYSLRQSPDIYGAKISGSGLGDCVIGLGNK